MLLVCHQLSPTNADNVFTWDRAVFVADIVAWLEIDYARVLKSVMHERAFKTSTNYSFACLIFTLCREAGVPIWHFNTLRHLTGMVDIGLIRDEANIELHGEGTLLRCLYLERIWWR